MGRPILIGCANKAITIITLFTFVLSNLFYYFFFLFHDELRHFTLFANHYLVRAVVLSKFLLLTKFEGCTVSYGPSFVPFDLWPQREVHGP